MFLGFFFLSLSPVSPSLAWFGLTPEAESPSLHDIYVMFLCFIFFYLVTLTLQDWILIDRPHHRAGHTGTRDRFNVK